VLWMSRIDPPGLGSTFKSGKAGCATTAVAVKSRIKGKAVPSRTIGMDFIISFPKSTRWLS
jgi:hypothetical protein